jgi:hypothetical protein
MRYTTGPGGKQKWYYWLGVKELARCVGAAERRKLHGGNGATRFAMRDVRGAQLRGAQLHGAQWRGSVELKCGAKLKSGARRGGGEQALIIPGIAISVDF